ncbi:methyltransferase [Thalassotalea euphylliae]|uniref:methyltransferase n=1 Tax=Thalassotalea euphylliae TaxID=1655234 RepID=UPI00362D18FC
MSLSNLSQVLLRNSDELACSNALLVNMPVDGLYKEWLEEHPQAALHYFTNNKLAANELARISHPKVSHSFGAYLQVERSFDLVVIAFPKSKAELGFTLAMLANYLTPEARVLFVGDNKGGVKSVAKLAKDYVANCHKLDSARHCILFAGMYTAEQTPMNIDDWFHYYPLNIAGIEITVAALPGVFSQQGLDKGTKVLLENLPADYQGSVLDFGCGAGVISAVLATKFENIDITALDISALAVASSQKTLEINGLSGHVLASDGLAEVNNTFDHIISNPPFHQGLKTHYAATETFLAECKRYLANRGSLTVVANSFLKYQPIIEQQFGRLTTKFTENGFTVYFATK